MKTYRSVSLCVRRISSRPTTLALRVLLRPPPQRMIDDNPILPARVIVIVASSRPRVLARELAHLLDVTGRHHSLSESSNRALRVFVLAHSHLRRYRSPSSSVAASARVVASVHPSVPRVVVVVGRRSHLRLERALEREEVGKSTENERHRDRSSRVASSSSAASEDGARGTEPASRGRRRTVASIYHTHRLHTSYTIRIHPHTTFPYRDSIVYTPLGLTPPTLGPPPRSSLSLIVFFLSRRPSSFEAWEPPIRESSLVNQSLHRARPHIKYLARF